MSSFNINPNTSPKKSVILEEPNYDNKFVNAKNGTFTIIGADGKPIVADLGTLMMMVSLNRTENLDKQIALQLDDIQQRNNMISVLTDAMSKAREAKANGHSSSNIEVEWNGKKVKIDDLMKELGISWTPLGIKPGKSDAPAWEAKWDTNINNIKSRIDILNNDSQMANIKLQNVLEKRNNSFEMATKVMQTNNQSVQSIIRNL